MVCARFENIPMIPCSTLQASCQPAKMMLQAIRLVFFLLAFAALSAAKPVAVIHIGPHKASSTYIQDVLSAKAHLLSTYGFYWPNATTGEPHAGKGIAKFAGSMKKHGSDNAARKEMAAFFKESLKLGRNVILSSEVFEELELEGVQILHSLLEGFEVKLVYVYRETLSHMISLHFELNRFDHPDLKYSIPFSQYLFTRMDSLSRVLNPQMTATKFGSVFGNDSIHIIDLAGCAAAKIDVAYVVVCEIAGILCDQPKIFGGASNLGYGLVVSEVFSHYKAFVETQNGGLCRFCDGTNSEYNAFRRQYGGFLLKNDKLPILDSKLGMLIPFSKELDTNLRMAFGKQIMHGNSTANYIVMRDKVYAEELDDAKFISSAHWAAWLETVFEAARTAKRLCNCPKRKSASWFW